VHGVSNVGFLGSATAISAGAEHTCALLSSGTVECWGSNTHGELGNSSTTYSWTPVQVSGISTAIQISARGNDSCALLSGGTVECWGENGNGELGNNSTADSDIPVAVDGITNATNVITGEYHSCALLLGGTVKCWGDDGVGELGDGKTAISSSVPVAVSNITNATQVSAAYLRTCALLASGTVDCWGTNYGSTPVQVTGAGTAGLSFSTANYTVNEGGGSAQVTIERTGDKSSAASVTFKTANGSATSGKDYTAVSKTVSFAVGETSKTVSIAIADRGLTSGSKTVSLSLSNTSANAELGSPSTAKLTILDNDQALAFSSSKYQTKNFHSTGHIRKIHAAGTSGQTQLSLRC